MASGLKPEWSLGFVFARPLPFVQCYLQRRTINMPRGRNGMRRGRRSRKGGKNGVGTDQAGFTLTKRVPDCHRFVRRDFVPVDSGTAGTPQGLAFSFSLDQLPNYTDFTNLFDHYSIDRIDLVAIPGVNPAQIYSAPDFDDAVAPTGVADLLERQNCTVQVVGPNSYQQFRRTIVPRMPMEGGTAAGPQLAPVGTPVDTADPSVQYFGFKLWIVPTNPIITLPFAGWTFVVTYHLRLWAAK